jgi:hypothetical protein
MIISIVTDLINMLPGNSSVNMVQHTTIEETVFSVDPTNAHIDWLDSDDMIYRFTVGRCPFSSYISKSDNSFTAVTSSSSSGRACKQASKQ